MQRFVVSAHLTRLRASLSRPDAATENPSPKFGLSGAHRYRDEVSFSAVVKTFRRKALAAVILLSVACGLAACGGSGTPSAKSCPTLPTPSPSNLGSVVDPLVENEMAAQGLVGMSVAIAKNGTILYSQGYGYADLSTCEAVQPDIPFQIGSVTKQFTAAAVLQLQNAGTLNIDNPVVSYLGSYPFDARITLRMLLNQTSGLPDYHNFPAANSWINGVPEQTVLSEIAAATLLFTPGSAYAYSNSNYFVLGSVIEAASGIIYGDFMAANIFQPVGLSSTSYGRPPAFASPYNAAHGPGVIADPSYNFAAGALWSNVQDLTTWDAALLNGKVLPAPLFTVMVTPANVPDYPQGQPSKYAMGWVRGTVVGHPFVWHNGETFSYTAFNAMFLDDGFSVALLANGAVTEDVPFFTLGDQSIQGVCTSSATAASC
ncbi:MAG: serine hydrolase domain-containing protein [Candidatus Acidiferrales bacterium]